jgi:hypothetical protein
MNNLPHSALYIGYEEKCIEEMVSTKFLDLQVDNHLNWKNHVEQMICKLSGVCYAVRSMFHIGNITTIRSIYFAYFNSFVKCRIMFWSNSSNSGTMVTLQKKIVRIFVGCMTQNFM